MTTDDLPGEFVTLQRDEVAARYRRDYRLRNPAAEVGPGTQPDLDARTLADTTMPLYSNAILIANGLNEGDATGDRLERIGDRIGLPRAGAVGASGFVAITASAAGGNVLEGDEIYDPSTNLRYKCATTGHYNDGSHVPVRGLDTGPATNQDPGVVLQWTAPRPGIGPNASVVEQADGTGLSGGREKESDAAYQNRIRLTKRTPPASGNDAEVQQLIEKTPGVAVEKCFSYPSIRGPGSHAFVFTLKPSKPGGSRIPNSAQVNEAFAALVGHLPVDDSYFPATLAADSTDIVLRVDWSPSVPGWNDVAPWPPYLEETPTTGPGAVRVQSALNALTFTLETANGDYTGITQPSPGNVLAFWDPSQGTFVRKQIKSILGTGPWLLSIETDNNASDETLIPSVGQRAAPWSDSLESIPAPVLEYFDALGPGEQVASFFDEGFRHRRDPRSPKEWSSVITNQLLTGVLQLVGVQNASLTEGLGKVTQVGNPGTLSHLMELKNLSVFPL